LHSSVESSVFRPVVISTETPFEMPFSSVPHVSAVNVSEGKQAIN
jgi:hypothetical protein